MYKYYWFRLRYPSFLTRLIGREDNSPLFTRLLMALLALLLPLLLLLRGLAGSWQEEAVALLCSQGHQAVLEGRDVASTVVDGLSVDYD